MFKMNRIQHNGNEKQQAFSLSEMEDFADQIGEIKEIENMDDLCGCWRSEQLSPTVLIFKDHKIYKFLFLHVDDLGQVIPVVHFLKEGRVQTADGEIMLSLGDDNVLIVWGLGEYVKQAEI